MLSALYTALFSKLFSRKSSVVLLLVIVATYTRAQPSNTSSNEVCSVDQSAVSLTDACEGFTDSLVVARCARRYIQHALVSGSASTPLMCVGHRMMEARAVDDCHLLAHGMADVLWEREMSALKEADNGTSFSNILSSAVKIITKQCDAICFHGCIHKTVVNFVEIISCSDCPNADDKLMTAFGSDSALLAPDVMTAAQHGLGHGLTKLRNVTRAIEFCNRADFKDNCLGGAFMEFFEDKTDLESNATKWIAGACESFGDLRALCAWSAGQSAMFAMWHNESRANKACDQISDEDALVFSCKKGVTAEKTIHDSELETDRVLCEAIVDKKTVCFAADPSCGTCQSAISDSGCANEYMVDSVRAFDSQCSADLWDMSCAYVVQQQETACMPNAIGHGPLIVPDKPDNSTPSQPTVPVKPPVRARVISIVAALVVVMCTLAAIFAVIWWYRRRKTEIRELGSGHSISTRKGGFLMLHDDDYGENGGGSEMKLVDDDGSALELATVITDRHLLLDDSESDERRLSSVIARPHSARRHRQRDMGPPPERETQGDDVRIAMLEQRPVYSVKGSDDSDDSDTEMEARITGDVEI